MTAEDTDFENPEKFIYQIVESRILGTGVQLSIERLKSCLAYRKIPIWGIKKPLYVFIKKMYADLTFNLNLKQFEFSSSFVEKKIIFLRDDYGIHKPILEEKLKQIMEPSENWNAMDALLKTGMLINAFIDAFDESYEYNIEHPETKFKNATEEANYQRVRNILQRRFKSTNKEPNESSIKINYKLEDFGFIFRAHNYVSHINNFYHNGFANVLKRLDNSLKDLYQEYFMSGDKKNGTMSSRYTGASMSPVRKQYFDDIDEKLMDQIKGDLASNDKDRILLAFGSIESKKLTYLKGDLELFFNNSDTEIQDRALNCYMKITDQ